MLLDAESQDLLFRQARTAHTFTAEPVTDEQVTALHDLVKWAPTAFNQQPLRAVLLRSPGSRARLVPLMDGDNRAKTASAPLTAILAADTEFHELLPVLLPHYPQAKDEYFADPTVRERRAGSTPRSRSRTSSSACGPSACPRAR
ncbi:nitroreductase family protein [Dactylosporangium sp. NPDC006015]|uniref:nitroreductase family protein n=1 Tax=Dactylosporangium sp. NPDC006015 TaxID=3154576 RepID=UPI0033B7C052